MSQKSQSSSQSRQKIRKECPNPIFEKWLMEWKQDAIEKNTKMQYVYAKALKSLQKYPLPLATGKECIILQFFGKGLCNMIDTKMMKENLYPSNQSQSSSSIDENPEEFSSLVQPSKNCGQDKNGRKKKLNTFYVPAYRSGAYAILVSLYKNQQRQGCRGYMLKSELQEESQQFCDVSMKIVANGSKYSGWNSISTLINKQLVLKSGHPAKYQITYEGEKLAKKLVQADSDTEPEESSPTDSQSTTSNSQTPDVTTMRPGTFEVILYVDVTETNRPNKKEDLLGELTKNGVKHEVIRLSVGDFIWVCRQFHESEPRFHHAEIAGRSRGLKALVLPYVVERKRGDDLAGSIKDGRFHEQKQRLKQSGLRPIYLIESKHDYGSCGLTDGALEKAIINTQIVNDFLIQETKSMTETVGFLTHMTRLLASLYKNKTVHSCTKENYDVLKCIEDETYLLPFHDFNEFGTKTKDWTVTEMFARQLMRLRGVSIERAYAISQKYPTLKSLLDEYDRCSSDKDRESLLAYIVYGNSSRTVGPAISRNFSKLYNIYNLKKE